MFASATIVGTEATGNGVAAASAPLGCGGAGFDGVAGDGVTVGRMASASASSARGGALDRGGGIGQCQDSCRIDVISGRAASSFSGRRWSRPAAAG